MLFIGVLFLFGVAIYIERFVFELEKILFSLNRKIVSDHFGRRQKFSKFRVKFIWFYFISKNVINGCCCIFKCLFFFGKI